MIGRSVARWVESTRLFLPDIGSTRQVPTSVYPETEYQPSKLDLGRWNLTRKGRVLSNADVVVISIPKSGRTWLKVFLKAYFSGVEKQPFSLRYRGRRENNTLDIRFNHDLWEHIVRADLRQRILGKHLTPASVLENKPVLLVAREPKDVMVSLYFHLTRRSRLFRGTISEMLRHDRYGIRPVIWIMNSWMKFLSGRSNFHLVRYEDMHADAAEVFRKVLDFTGHAEIAEDCFQAAMNQASFNSMKKLEASGGSGHKCLQPADASDPESYKVRRGIVGGYRDYLSSEDVDYLNREIRRLDPAYGYACR